MASTTYIPLSAIVPDGLWPEFLVDSQGGSLLDRIAYEEGDTTGTSETWGMFTRLRVLDELALANPLLGGIALVLGSGPLSGTINGSGFVWSAEIVSQLFKLRFPRTMLKPVIIQDGKPAADPDETHFSEIQFAANLQASSGGDVDLIWPGDVQTPISLPKSIIGDTGIMIEAQDVLLRLSSATPIPDAYAQLGLPDSWHGLLIERAAVTLPPDMDLPLPSEVAFEHCAIGTGGFSGTLETTLPSEVAGELGGLEFRLRTIALTFAQNVLTRSELRGSMKLPFFDEMVDVSVAFSLSGEWLVQISSADGLANLHKDDTFDLRLESVAFVLQDGQLTTILSGQLLPAFGGLNWPSFEIRELAIDSDGNVHIQGGWINLRDQYTLDFYNFHIEITKLGFGKKEDGGKWVGFSGAIRLVDGFSAGASVEGLRITWYDDDRATRISMDGVGVEFEVPGVLSFKGFVAYRKVSETEHRFDGDVRLTLDALKGMGFDAQLVIGSSQQSTYYAIYLGVELPAGIPLGATGLGLYGMAGLFANQMVPDKKADEEWYEGWYKRNGSNGQAGAANLTKWTNKPGMDSLALGAGVTLGTVFDNGFAFSGKVLLVIVFPGPIILLEGKANILRERASLSTDEPIFRMLGVLDGTSDSVLFALGAQYKFADSGQLIDISGDAEAFFSWADASTWHLFVGQDQPRERRIRAEVFKMFSAESFFMLTADSVKTGARVGWDKSWKFGPLRVSVEAWIEGGAAVSWSPAHFHGDLWLHGAAELSAFGFGLGLSVDARLAADVFDPFHLRGDFRVRINLPWPLPDPKATITLEWGPEKQWPAIPTPLKEIAIEHDKVSTKWPLAPAVLPAEPDVPPNLSGLATVPLDARPGLTFSRPMNDTHGVGDNAQLPVPDSEWIGDPEQQQGPAKVRYSLEAVALYKRVDSAWQLVGKTPPDDASMPLLYGSWANVPSDDGSTEEISQSKLLLWSKTPFDYTRHAGREWNDWFINNYPSYPCPPDYPDQEICCTFDDIDPAVPLLSPWVCQEYPLRLIWFNNTPEVQVRFPDPDVHAPPSVILLFKDFENRYEIWIELDRPAKKVTLKLGEGNQGSHKITWYDSRRQAHGPFDVPRDGSLAITIDGPDIALVKIAAAGDISLDSICLTNGLSDAQEGLRAALVQHMQDELVHWEQTDTVLEPHTIYRLIVTTLADATGHGPLEGETRPNTQSMYADFQTGGPPGVPPDQFSPPLAPPPEAFTSGLDDLRPYVRQTIPLTVPAVGEKPLLPRPVYRAYDVQVDFDRNYVDLMYRMEQRDLGLYLYDQNNRPVRDTQGRLVSMSPNWADQEQITLKESAQLWFDVLAGSQCLSFTLPAVAADRTLVHSAEYLLEPDSLHEARLIPLLLHEDFSSYAAGAATNGPSGRLGSWQILDLGIGGPSHWQVGTVGDPPSHFVAQTTGIAGGSNAAGSPDKPGTQLLFTRDRIVDQGDYRLSVSVRATSGDGSLGVVFRHFNSAFYYRYAMDRRDGYRRLVRVVAGTATTLASDAFAYNQNQDYLITVEAIGPLLRVYQDGALVFEVTDATHPQGWVGLYCWRNAGARFADVRVDDFQRTAPVVYRFGFTTSRFANFFHHLHSFRDRLWPTEVPAALSNTVLTTRLGHAVAPSVPVGEDEARDYDFLAQAILGAAAAQQPAQLEVLRIARNGTTHALLVLSPEPIDWERTSLALASSSTQITTSTLPERLKITGVTFGTSQPNQESVRLILHQDADLSGWRVEYRPLAGAALGSDWLPYYTFAAGDDSAEAFRSGTRVHIYAGNANAAPSAPPNTVQRFIATGSESGALRLPGAGAELRLVRADGSVEHARQFLPDSAYATQTVKLLRRADGTGVFLVASSFPQRTYRLTATYKRNIGKGKPHLREAGSSDDEQVILDIPWS